MDRSPVRGRTFQQALHHASAGRLDWLRRLHCSHSPRIGPFSTCMHRADAATVSYTEITVSPRDAVMHYYAGSPCQKAARRPIFFKFDGDFDEAARQRCTTHELPVAKRLRSDRDTDCINSN
jgi:hypothetical protein